ncbi:NifB/NifX family molybdenum-iron cluster-binding protein [bacterium]|nr:NifB/NifX family molybdenum-iron cluster-binding protein [bacterium]
MKVCLPVEMDKALESQVSDHFGSATCFMVFDEESGELKPHENTNIDHEPGQCNPLSSFGENIPDIVIVKGMGAGALKKLMEAGVKVFRAEADTIKENLDILTSRGLLRFTPQDACSGHDHQNNNESCGHHHGHSCSH